MLVSPAMMRTLAAAVAVAAALAACGGGEDNSGKLWATYLDVTGFDAEEAPADRDEIAEATDGFCDQTDTTRAAFVAMAEEDTPGGVELAVALTAVECPEESVRIAELAREN